MASSVRSLLMSAVVFISGVALWFGAGVLRGLAHVSGLPILPLLEVILYAGVFVMLAGVILLAVFIPRWSAARRG